MTRRTFSARILMEKIRDRIRLPTKGAVCFVINVVVLSMLFGGWPQTSVAQLQKEEINVTRLSSTPRGWKQKGMWMYDQGMVMAPQKGHEACLRRALQGDGHIIAQLHVNDELLSTTSGVCFSFSTGTINLEQRIVDGVPFVVMELLDQGGTGLGEKVLSIPAGSVELMLRRKGNHFSGWVAEPGKDFQQVGGLDWNEVGLLIEAGIYARVFEGGASLVRVNSLEVVGLRPEVVTMSRKSLSEGYKSTPDSPRKPPSSVDRQATASTPRERSRPRSSDGRFIDNLDGTIMDTYTGLMWTKKDSCADLGHCLNWDNSRVYALKLKTGGHIDWRMPTVEELYTLFEKYKINSDADGNTIHIDPIFAPGSSAEPWASDIISSVERGYLEFWTGSFDPGGPAGLWSWCQAGGKNPRGVRAVRSAK